MLEYKVEKGSETTITILTTQEQGYKMCVIQNTHSIIRRSRTKQTQNNFHTTKAFVSPISSQAKQINSIVALCAFPSWLHPGGGARRRGGVLLHDASARGDGWVGAVQDGLGRRDDTPRRVRRGLEALHSDNVLDLYVLAKGTIVLLLGI